MGTENSPSLDEFAQGMPLELPDPSKKRKRLWTIIGILSAIALMLAGNMFVISDTAAILAGTGTVTGVVVDENNQPMPGAEIYVLGSRVKGESDAYGFFEVQDVPAGSRSIVVACGGTGYEYPILVIAGESVDLGEVRFISTLEPEL